jgi:hexosaminidase
MPINEIILHSFEQTGSWIYRPTSVSFYESNDAVQYKLLETVTNLNSNKHVSYVSRTKTQARYIKIVAQNKGIIGDGLPGAGNKAWLFVHEIEIN